MNVNKKLMWVWGKYWEKGTPQRALIDWKAVAPHLCFIGIIHATFDRFTVDRSAMESLENKIEKNAEAFRFLVSSASLPITLCL